MAAAVAPPQLLAVLQLIGFSVPASFAVVNGGYNSFDELATLTDDEVEGLCKSIRRPGGMILTPPAVAGGPPGPPIPNPGLEVPRRAETNMKLLCYYLRFCIRTSEPVVAANMTLVNIRALRAQKDQEKDHTEPDAPEINDANWTRTMEAIQEYLGACLGVTKIPLAYVIRTLLPPAPMPAAGWSSNEEQMIARAPLVVDPMAPLPAYTPTFKSDNKKVWLKIAAITRDKDCWTYIRNLQATQNGRAAYMALYDHYLGAHNMHTMSANAERKLATTTYTGEKRHWTFEKYTRIHVDQHMILEGLVPYGYAGIDEGSKVRHFVNGIKTNTLDSVKTNVMASPILRSDFRGTASLYKDFIAQMKAMNPDRNITIAKVSAANDNDNEDDYDSDSQQQIAGFSANGVKPDMSVEERYYKRDEFKRLTPEQRAGLLAKRAIRDEGRGSGGKKKKGTQPKAKGKKVTLSKVSLAAVVAHTVEQLKHPPAQLKDDDDYTSDGSSVSEEEVPMKGPANKKQKIVNNRNNPALNRGKK